MIEVPISQACDVNPPKPKLGSLADDVPVLFVPMAAVDEISGTVSDPQTRTLGELRKKSYRSFQPGDVIFAKITPCMENGKSAIVPEIPSAIGFGSTEFHVLRPKPHVDARYLWHFVRRTAFRHEARDAMTGSVGQARVPASFLENYPIPLPSEEDQQQISDLLDSALASARSGTTHLLAARRAVAKFRQAVLAAACSGTLTADWRDNNTPGEAAAAFIARIDESRRTRLGRKYSPPSTPTGERDLPDGWSWTTVGALVDVATGATPLRKRADYYGGEIPWVTSGAVNAGLIAEAHEFITELAIRETNAKVFPPGTLLVAMYGEGQTRGRVAELAIAAATNQAVAALLFDEETDLLRDYLRVFFSENYERIRLLSFGGVQPNLSLGVIRDTTLPLPPHDEQIEIVRRVTRLLSLADGLSEKISKASKHVDRSSQAILAKAFRGGLTP